jgi:20S proteasome subunit beta 4
MEALVGLKGRDFVLVSAESSVMNSYLVIKRKDDKFSDLNESVSLVYNGDQGDAFRTAKFVVEDLKYRQLESNLKINPKVVSCSIQNKIYEKLRVNPLKCGFLVGGMSCNNPELYSIDNYGASFKENFIAMGMGIYFCYGILDNNYKEDLSQEEGIEIIKKCYKVLKERCSLNIEGVTIKVVSNSGIESIDLEIK